MNDNLCGICGKTELEHSFGYSERKHKFTKPLKPESYETILSHQAARIQALEARLERAEGLLTMAVEHWTTSDKVMGFLQRNKWCEEAQAFLSEAQK